MNRIRAHVRSVLNRGARWCRGYGVQVVIERSWVRLLAGALPACLGQLGGVKAGRVHLCLVARNTVWSHMAGDILLDWSPINRLTAIYVPVTFIMQ